ncbi:MAG TPA: dTDP-4-dehydrorhamnose reductase [Roseiflexaceae bacterium]|nr:dTDP-4-dehydrorhamnose reductase [Roseiflexaceae bacterium]HMP40158.1 dTDP-4-dehydrorhamnose reductase [Roseiflexaceae bacterium]
MHNMRIAITGAAGQLGRALQAALADRHDLVLLTHNDIELAAPAAISQIAATAADLVIHSAAYTNVDGCARDPERAYRANALGTRYVALGCRRMNAALVYISTNEVFDGAAAHPYFEYDQPAPINAYGRSKYAGEQAVRELVPQHYIARVAWLFGGERNFVRTVLRLASEHNEIAMVADEIGSPTYTADAAAAIAALIEQPIYGTYHIVNSGACSRYEFARAILQHTGLGHVALRPITLADFKRDSMVPPHTPLHNIAAADLGVRLRDWQAALAAYLATIHA